MEVTAGQILTPAQAAQLKFQPTPASPAAPHSPTAPPTIAVQLMPHRQPSPSP
uniref:hypothetical protein n=1 Tax=Kamptonema formosum TaxID=331992 RepID=UPI00350F1993